MQLKKFLLFGLMAAVLPAVAEEAADRKTATSLKYVTHELDTRQNKFTAEQNKAMEYTDSAGTVQKRAVTSELGTSMSDTSLPMVGGVNTKLATKQDDIDPFNDHTAVTYTGQPGGIGRKGIYQTSESYANQSDNLIDAKTFNAALKNGLDSEFKCREDNLDPVSGLCWLYTIHNNTSVLPDGYTELEYIISNGTQYFDSGRKATEKSEVSVSAMATVSDSTKNRLIGNYADTSRAFTLNMSTTGGSSRFGNQVFVGIAMPIGSKHVFSNGVAGLRMDAEVLRAWTAQPAFETPGNVALLASTNTTTTVPSNLTNGLAGNTYNITWHEDGVLVMNLIPARRNQDSVVGMYDRVSGTFFENAGTGVFQAGPPVSAIVYIPQNQ